MTITTTGVALAGLTPAEVLYEALAQARHGFVEVDGLEVITRPGWLQLVMPAWKNGGLNVVALTQVDDDDAEAVIDRTIAQYVALGLKFRWVVDPDSRPLDLDERLTRRGLERIPGSALACATADAATLALPDGVTVERVTLDNLRAFEETMAAGWGMDPDAIRPYHLKLLEDPARNRMYLARYQGAPAGCAAQTCFARSTYLTGGVVLPDFRGKGVYRALVAGRLRDAAASGVVLATTHARGSTSAPILERVGFVTVCDLVSFSN